MSLNKQTPAQLLRDLKTFGYAHNIFQIQLSRQHKNYLSQDITNLYLHIHVMSVLMNNNTLACIFISIQKHIGK